MLAQPGSEIFVPDASPVPRALARTTHLGVAAHADDLEIMAVHGILACYGSQENWFTGVVVTDGVGGPSAERTTDPAALRETRRAEQKRAAELGRYGAVALLDHSSQAVKDGSATRVVADLRALLRDTRPQVVYTHALSDAHDTHVAVTLRLLTACRELDPAERPPRILGCEVWRDLDWLAPPDQVILPVDEHEELQAALIAEFRSQLESGKRFDRAVLGRRHAHAVFSRSHEHDRYDRVVLAMDLTALAAGGDPAEYLRDLFGRLEDDSLRRVERLTSILADFPV